MAVLMVACSIALLACARSQASVGGPSRVVPGSAAPSDLAAATFVDAGNWAAHVGPVLDQPVRAPTAQPGATTAVHTAVMSDDGEDSDEPVLSGRLVYRVSFSVPPSFRDHRAQVQAPAGELHVDLSRTRLRARFVGPGWPVPEGSELRLRADLPGLYLFDGGGGRSLGAGQLASWFEGQRGLRPALSRAAIRRDYGPRAEGPLAGDMICALLAEWSNQPREALAYRCNTDSLPPAFRIGPWSAELTAVVPISVPRHTLRADDAEPPRALPAARAPGPMLEPSALAHLEPSRALPGPAGAALVVDNRSPTRVLMIIQGVPISWVDADSVLTITGFAPGYYRIGGVRPLGVLRMPPKLLAIPGRLVLGHSSEVAQPEDAHPEIAQPAVTHPEPEHGELDQHQPTPADSAPPSSAVQPERVPADPFDTAPPRSADAVPSVEAPGGQLPSPGPL